MTNFLKNHWTYAVLILIMSFGIFFRFWAISETPPGIHLNEAKNANDAVNILLAKDDGEITLENNTSETLFVWLLALSFQYFGINIFALKFVSAMAGSLSILGIYLATKEILLYSSKHNDEGLKFKLSPTNIETAALLAAGFLATSFWHINFSRIAFGSILVPLLISFGIYFGFKFLKIKKVIPAVAAFIALVLAAYAYIASYYVEVSITDSVNPLVALFKGFGTHIQMLMFTGDANWIHNFSGEAQLSFPVALMFVAGLIYSGIAMLSALKRKHENSITTHLVLLSGFIIMLIPAAFATDTAPNALRAIGLIPFIFIYAALGFLYIIKIIFPHKHHREEIWPFVFGSALIIIMLLASSQFTYYFVQWSKNENVKEVFSESYVEIGKYLNAVDNAQKYLIINKEEALVYYPSEVISPFHDGNKLPATAQPALFIQRTKEPNIKDTTYILPNELPLHPGNSIFIPLNPKEDIKNRLRNLYPQGVEVEVNGIWLYKVD